MALEVLEKRTEVEKEALSEMVINPLFNQFKQNVRSQDIKVGNDKERFLMAARKADSIARDHPHILDAFAIKLAPSGKDDMVTRKYDRDNLVHRLLYYRANPWRFAYEVLSPAVLNMTAPAGTVFKYFIRQQKLFLRDILDPREPLIIASCNRGGSKTWLCGLAIAVACFLSPKIKITILGGSKDQSINLYNYFKIFLENSQLKDLVQGESLQTLTRFVHGGYVRALPASEKSVRGPRPDMLFLDETCEAESRVIKSALPQVLTASKLKVIATSTPHRMVHLFRDWWIYPDYGFKKHHWNAYDCYWIPRENIEIMKKTYTREEFTIEVLGEFAPVSGSVFDPESIYYATQHTDLPEFVTNVNDWYPDVPSGVLTSLRRVTNGYGLDWGFEHPSVLTGGFLGNDGCVYITSDFEMHRWRDLDIFQRVVEEVGAHNGDVFADSSHVFQNQNLRDRLAPLGASCIPVVYRAIKMRMVENVKLWLENKRLFIIKDDCEKLVTQLLNYSYKEGTDKPEKIDDDHVDSLLNLMWGMRGYLNYGLAGSIGKVTNAAGMLESENVEPYRPIITMRRKWNR